jgi:K+/H+ antiporter YhaU regulatory subunit KhtT
MMTEFEEFLRRKVIEVFYVSPESVWADRTVGELPAGGEPGITLLAVLRGDQAIVRPHSSVTLLPGDKLVLFGGHGPLAAVLDDLSRAVR